MRRWWGTILLALALISAFVLWFHEAKPREPSASLTNALRPPPDLRGFRRATEPGPLSFPDAFGPHPDYQSEWWYYTGNVETVSGRPFGYQLTFFRRALTPDAPARESALAANQVYMAHFALTD
ncbi:MAG: lipocalin-like domain-containing protein, partial [Ardenticatenaceae bacterium]